MSMVSSLDALDAATDTTSAPRAAVFQPKVKPRARKGTAVGEPRRAAVVPAGSRDQSTGSIDPPSVSGSGNVQAAEIETCGVNSESLSKKPTSSVVDNDVVVRSASSETHLVTEDDAHTNVELNCLEVDPSVHNSSLLGSALEDPVVPEVSISHDLNVGLKDLARSERPPVAIRSNFPLPVPTTAKSSADAASPASLGISNKPAVSQENEGFDLNEPDLRKSAEVDGEAGPTTHSTSAMKEMAGQDIENVARDDPEPVSEVLPTTKRKRKAGFPHATKRGKRVEEGSVESQVDFSKTDLSNPGKLTMREIIRRAEAIERKKMKAEGAKKAAEDVGKQKQTPVEAAERETPAMAPQVQVIDGRIVINEQSLTIGAYETTKQNTDSYKRVEENASRLNYHSYSNRVTTERWKSDDTDLFYKALEQFGTDFELIQNLFPGRTRRQVKAKFKKEERKNPKRLQVALTHRPNDQSHYTNMISRLKAEDGDGIA